MYAGRSGEIGISIRSLNCSLFNAQNQLLKFIWSSEMAEKKYAKKRISFRWFHCSINIVDAMNLLAFRILNMYFQTKPTENCMMHYILDELEWISRERPQWIIHDFQLKAWNDIRRATQIFPEKNESVS